MQAVIVIDLEIPEKVLRLLFILLSFRLLDEIGALDIISRRKMTQKKMTFS